jgi:serine phosphatase RsbU (regulator of sigma subunit)/anti-sigma regulatory factor (Ser/Thr protein kinase)
MTPGRPRRPVWSIRWIVACAAVVLTTLVVLGVSGFMEKRTRDVLAREIESRLMLQARNLALTSSGAIVTDYPELTLAPLVREMQTRQHELTLVVVLDRAGNIQGHSDVRLLSGPFTPPPGIVPVPTTAPLGPHESISGNAEILMASAPILNSRGEILGTALVGLSRAYVDEALSQIRRQQFLILAGFLLAGAALSFGLMSILLRPIGALRAGIERIGRGDLSTPLRLRDRTEFGLLAEEVNGMASALKKAQEEMVERERLAREMELARQIQRSILPSGQTVVGDFVIHGGHWAAAEVGGDYYDVIPLPDGNVALAVADVSGKGLAGCLITAMIFSLLRALRSIHASPAELLAVLDERLGETLQRGSFVTMFYGELDSKSGRLVYSSAGHNPILVYRARTGRTEWHRSKGIPLGAIRGGAIRRTLEDAVIDLAADDVLVQFTDGINETTDLSGQEFGFERMEKAVLEAAPSGAHEVVSRLHGAVAKWRGDGAPMDDETVLVVSREGSAKTGGGAAPGGSALGLLEALGRFAEAKKHGQSIQLPATLDSLTGIRAWLDRSGALRGLSPGAADMLDLALYEVCANVAEHGYGQDAARSFELWWMPIEAKAGPAPRGQFFIRDQGRPFRPDRSKETDYHDPSVRKRGRGFGLDIIYRTMTAVAYHPGTNVGNMTILEWDPRKVDQPDEVRHA